MKKIEKIKDTPLLTRINIINKINEIIDEINNINAYLKKENWIKKDIEYHNNLEQHFAKDPEPDLSNLIVSEGEIIEKIPNTIAKRNIDLEKLSLFINEEYKPEKTSKTSLTVCCDCKYMQNNNCIEKSGTCYNGTCFIHTKEKREIPEEIIRKLKLIIKFNRKKKRFWIANNLEQILKILEGINENI